MLGEFVLLAVLALALTLWLKPLLEKVFKIKLDLAGTFRVASIFAICLIFNAAFAQDGSVAIPSEAAPPEWILGVVEWLKTIPKVGPIVVTVLSYVATVATVFTAVSLAAQAVLKALEIPLRWSGASKIADKIKKVHDVVVPILQKLSIFNAPAKK